MGVLRKSKIDEVKPQLPSIGRIYKGSKKQEKKNSKGEPYLIYGKDLDHFRFEPDERLKNLPSNEFASLYDEVATKWHHMEHMTSGWRSIPILLPYRTINQNFWFRNAVYDKSGRTTRSCNGEFCDRYPMDAKKADGKPYKAVVQGWIPCAMGENDTECPAGCKSEGKLSMIIPHLYPGLVLLTTRSTIDIQTLIGNLKGYERFDLSRIPMRLCRSLRDASYTDANGEFRKQEKWLLHIEIDPQFGHAALEAQQQQYRAELMGSYGGSLSLPSGIERIAPTEFVDDEFEASISPNEIDELANLTGHTSAQVWTIAANLQINPDSMSQSEWHSLREGLLGAWAFGQGGFKAKAHAYNAVKKIVNAEMSNQECFEAVAADVAKRKTEQTEVTA